MPSDIDPERTDLLYARAREESRAGRSVEAARLFEQIANTQTMEKGRAIFLLLASNEYLKTKEYDKAIEDCRWAIAIEPHSPQVWLQLGHLLQVVGRYKEAQEALIKSIAVSPSKVGYVYLGSVQVDLGQLSDAEHSFMNAIELAPEFDEAYYNLGCVLRDQGRIEEAFEAFHQAVRFSPDDADAHGALGEVCLWQGKIKEGLQHLRKCLEINPDDVKAKELLKPLEDSRRKGGGKGGGAQEEGKGDAAQ